MKQHIGKKHEAQHLWIGGTRQGCQKWNYYFTIKITNSASFNILDSKLTVVLKLTLLSLSAFLMVPKASFERQCESTK